MAETRATPPPQDRSRWEGPVEHDDAEEGTAYLRNVHAAGPDPVDLGDGTTVDLSQLESVIIRETYTEDPVVMVRDRVRATWKSGEVTMYFGDAAHRLALAIDHRRPHPKAETM